MTIFSALNRAHASRTYSVQGEACPFPMAHPPPGFLPSFPIHIWIDRKKREGSCACLQRAEKQFHNISTVDQIGAASRELTNFNGN